MDEDLKKHLEQLLTQLCGAKTEISAAASVGGGCINNAMKLNTSAGTFFLKTNSATSFPGMFKSEAKGLEILKSANVIHVPEPIAEGEFNDTAFILIEYINEGTGKKSFWQDFGKKLALLHRKTNEYYGLDHDNYIGSLKQYNKKSYSWIDFFIKQRLMPQLETALHANRISSTTISSFEKLFKKLPDLLPEEAPALLHGDLWGGNFLINEKGEASLIDPAVYYGHREVDLAMTRLFGGFNEIFYHSYNEEWPLEKNYSLRLDIYNLYPLLVHVNLFGGGYLTQVNTILQSILR